MSEAWDSTCEMCNFHYYNAEGDGPVKISDAHGSNGWKTIHELEDDVKEEGCEFFIIVYIEMLHRGYELICGNCVDELIECEEEEE